MGAAWPNPRFSDHGDGTVTDNLTGLMWTKDANIYGTRDWTQALSDCASCMEGSYDDWRLPNVRELQSLVDYGLCEPALPDGGTSFNNVQSLYYWSSTSSVYDFPNGAWIVRLAFGNVNNNVKWGNYYVWCVRGSGQ
jgi:hypothetical protein